MLAEELMDTMDYLREVAASVTRPLGTNLLEAQLRELEKVIRRLDSVAGCKTDQDRSSEIMAVLHQAKACRCRIQSNLMTLQAKRNCVMARVA